VIVVLEVVRVVIREVEVATLVYVKLMDKNVKVDCVLVRIVETEVESEWMLGEDVDAAVKGTDGVDDLLEETVDEEPMLAAGEVDRLAGTLLETSVVPLGAVRVADELGELVE
jgi:hypothetical protein